MRVHDAQNDRQGALDAHETWHVGIDQYIVLCAYHFPLDHHSPVQKPLHEAAPFRIEHTSPSTTPQDEHDTPES